MTHFLNFSVTAAKQRITKRFLCAVWSDARVRVLNLGWLFKWNAQSFSTHCRSSLLCNRISVNAQQTAMF